MRTIEKHKLRQSKSFKEQHPILDGDAIIYRTTQNGNVYQFRTWISAEKKYYRKSLKTRDLDTARERAKSLYYEIMHQVRSGKKIFGLTFGELVEEFLKYQDQRVQTGRITRGRYSTIKTQLTKHLLGFVGGNTKVSEIDLGKFYEFSQYRRLTSKGVREVTIRNEQTTLNSLFRWGFRNGYIYFERVDFEEIKVRTVERRDTFTIDEFKHLHDFLDGWVKEGDLSRRLRERRLFIRDFILIKANSFLRFGEIRFLKWGEVRVFGNKGEVYAEIRVRAETAKNRKERKLISRDGYYFKRLQRNSNHTKKDDYVFVDNETGNVISKKVYYELWKDIMGKSGLGEVGKKLSYYSLRHFGITSEGMQVSPSKICLSLPELLSHLLKTITRTSIREECLK